MVSQVKGGSTGPGDVQAFNGARQQAGADLGIFTCFDERVTTGMKDAAASAGRFMEVRNSFRLASSQNPTEGGTATFSEKAKSLCALTLSGNTIASAPTVKDPAYRRAPLYIRLTGASGSNNVEVPPR